MEQTYITCSIYLRAWGLSMAQHVRRLLLMRHPQESMLTLFKRQVQGFAYLLFHPYYLKRMIIREIVYGRRYESKQGWVEWQIFDSYTSAPQHGSEVSLARPLNIARIKIISGMVKNVGSNLKVLDVGCGDGAIGEAIRKMGNTVVSLELPKVAVLAKKHYKVPLIVAGDAEHLPFRKEAFDAVLSSELMEHLWDPHSFVEETYKVLRDNGHLIVATPEGPESLRYDAHKHYFTVETLKKMLCDKFVLCEFKRLGPICAPTSTIILLFRKVLAGN
jgi:2-polyprenyl-3-methyl-5-hydroxy-6-metoxy-1,4-benzoquinol methylase